MLNDRGNLDAQIGDPSWKDEPIDGPTYHDEIQIWKEYDSNSTTSNTLSTIDDIERYNLDHLSRKLGGITEDLTPNDNFLDIFSIQRHQNIHGEMSTQVIGPVVLNLCCLIIWDSVKGEDEYAQNREQVIEHIESQQRMGPQLGGHPNTPSSFYPLP